MTLQRHFCDGRHLLLEALAYSSDTVDVRLDIVDAQGAKGQLFVGNGAFDWARCDHQEIDIKVRLAEFLQIRPAEIAMSLRRNAGDAGISALAELVQRHGLEPHPVLRQCIDAHVTSALCAIAELGACEAQIAHYEKGPTLLASNQAWKVLLGARFLKTGLAVAACSSDAGATERVATHTFGLPSVSCVLVFDLGGRLRAVRSAAGAENKLRALLADAIDFDCVNENSSLGALTCFVAEHEAAIVVRHRLQGPNGLLVLLLLERTGRLGAIKHRLERLEIDCELWAAMPASIGKT